MLLEGICPKGRRLPPQYPGKGEVSMKKLLVLSCLAGFIFCVVGSAGALVYYSDEYDPNHDLFLRGWCHDSVSWEFNIRDHGFVPGERDVVSAEVQLFLYDDGGCFDFWEVAKLGIGDNTFWWEVDTGDLSFSVASLMTLNTSGTVECTLTACLGDFYFDKGVLNVGATDGPIAPVPEPSIMLLLGCGFVCVAGFGWKRFSKKSTDDRQ